ncbi:MAG: hypothetical protein Q7T59_05380 [Candidatus Woesebacteria bacterium]|nr:hypothetical protein [Candidatus Woesebacteria bacterium]
MIVELFMKLKCSKCLKTLDESEFNWKFKNIKRSYHCKNCSRIYIRNHYLNNTEYYIRKARKRDKIIKDQARKYIGQYLLDHPCKDCGENDIFVLEFDHRDRKEKKGEITKIIRNKSSLRGVVAEIDKCDVRCANCHRRKTEKENGSWKVKYISTRSSTG